jgi:hypothetical protein
MESGGSFGRAGTHEGGWKGIMSNYSANAVVQVLAELWRLREVVDDKATTQLEV